MTSESASLFYLKGNAKNYFWPAAAILLWMLVWSAAWPYIWPVLLGGRLAGSRMAHIAAGIETFLHGAAWIMILLAYGLRNRIRAFAIIFLITAGVQLLGSYGHFLSSLGRYDTAYIQDVLTSGRYALVRGFSLLQQAAWFTFGIIVLCHPRTGGVLRAAAIVLIAANVIQLGYAFGFAAFFMTLARNISMEAVPRAINIMGHVMGIVTYGALLFFFGAMSFSRMKRVPESSERSQV